VHTGRSSQREQRHSDPCQRITWCSHVDASFCRCIARPFARATASSPQQMLVRTESLARAPAEPPAKEFSQGCPSMSLPRCLLAPRAA
jgi:hypothetical protein